MSYRTKTDPPVVVEAMRWLGAGKFDTTNPRGAPDWIFDALERDLLVLHPPATCHVPGARIAHVAQDLYLRGDDQTHVFVEVGEYVVCQPDGQLQAWAIERFHGAFVPCLQAERSNA